MIRTEKADDVIRRTEKPDDVIRRTEKCPDDVIRRTEKADDVIRRTEKPQPRAVPKPESRGVRGRCGTEQRSHSVFHSLHYRY